MLFLDVYIFAGFYNFIKNNKNTVKNINSIYTICIFSALSQSKIAIIFIKKAFFIITVFNYFYYFFYYYKILFLLLDIL